MERQLKQRIVGAALLVAFGVIFIPIFLDNGSLETAVPAQVDIPTAVPETPASAAPPADELNVEELERAIDTPLDTAADQTPTSIDRELDAPLPVAPVVPSSPSATEAATTNPSSAAPAVKKPTSGWAVQLGSFSSEANARRLIDKLRAAGFAAYLERHREADATVFKVRVGPEQRQADAEKLRARLEREFATKGILRPY